MENSIDEAMMRFNRRSSLKQYLPKKPIHRGMNVWVRADSTNRYICQFDIYTGKDGDSITTNLGESVVIKLTSGGNYHNNLQVLLCWKTFTKIIFTPVEPFALIENFPQELKEINQSIQTI